MELCCTSSINAIAIVLLFNSAYSCSNIFIRTQELDECDDYVTLIIILTYERVPDNHFRSICNTLSVYFLASDPFQKIGVFVV